jgi:beta-lactamase class A
VTTTTVTRELEQVFEEAGATGFIHAREVDGDRELGLNANDLVVTASVFKIPVLLETARQVAAGERAWSDRIRVTAKDRTLGPTGLSVMLDDVDLSLRDLAYLMMSVSDNTATDVIMGIVGLDRINATLRELGLERTELEGDCRVLLGTFTEDTGIERSAGLNLSDIDPEQLRKWRSLDPERTSRTTPAEMTRLLRLIWKDEAAAPEACAEVRRIMALQVWPHRLTSGFPSGVTLAAKTGTLPGIRNEAGVVTYPGGSRYAVAVFTRAHTYVDRQPMVDASVGKSAFRAVESLRGS